MFVHRRSLLDTVIGLGMYSLATPSLSQFNSILQTALTTEQTVLHLYGNVLVGHTVIKATPNSGLYSTLTTMCVATVANAQYCTVLT
jgi:hypothetical protein